MANRTRKGISVDVNMSSSNGLPPCIICGGQPDKTGELQKKLRDNSCGRDLCKILELPVLDKCIHAFEESNYCYPCFMDVYSVHGLMQQLSVVERAIERHKLNFVRLVRKSEASDHRGDCAPYDDVRQEILTRTGVVLLSAEDDWPPPNEHLTLLSPKMSDEFMEEHDEPIELDTEVDFIKSLPYSSVFPPPSDPGLEGHTCLPDMYSDEEYLIADPYPPEELIATTPIGPSSMYSPHQQHTTPFSVTADERPVTPTTLKDLQDANIRNSDATIINEEGNISSSTNIAQDDKPNVSISSTEYKEPDSTSNSVVAVDETEDSNSNAPSEDETDEKEQRSPAESVTVYNSSTTTAEHDDSNSPLNPENGSKDTKFDSECESSNTSEAEHQNEASPSPSITLEMQVNSFHVELESELDASAVVVGKKRGRPRKVRTPEQLAKEIERANYRRLMNSMGMTSSNSTGRGRPRKSFKSMDVDVAL